MDKREAIAFLKDSLREITHLVELPFNNYEYPLWRNTIKGILEEVFGSNSWEYQEFSDAYLRVTIGNYQKEYPAELQMRQAAIVSIINKHETLGIETKPSAISEPKDTAELPIYLFNKMQLHPKIIKSSEALFKDGHYASAILEAFKAVNKKLALSENNLLDTSKTKISHLNEDVEKKIKELGGNIVISETYNPEETDFKTSLIKINTT